MCNVYTKKMHRKKFLSTSVSFTEFFPNHPLTMAKITLPFHGLTHARCPAMSLMPLTCYRYKKLFRHLCSKTVSKGHPLQNISKPRNFWIYFFHVLFTGLFEVIRCLICMSPKTSQVPKRNLGQLYRALWLSSENKLDYETRDQFAT